MHPMKPQQDAALTEAVRAFDLLRRMREENRLKLKDLIPTRPIQHRWAGVCCFTGNYIIKSDGV